MKTTNFCSKWIVDNIIKITGEDSNCFRRWFSISSLSLVLLKSFSVCQAPKNNFNCLILLIVNELWTNYEQAKSWLRCKKLPPDIDSGGVFCNDRISLGEVEIYGYDYDYTLASYKKAIENLIHDFAKQHLVKKYGYPENVAKIIYDPHFPIRGKVCPLSERC